MDYSSWLLEIQKEFPGFRVIPKKMSLFMRFVDFFLFIVTFGSQKTFMTGYVTTIGQKVYVPEGWNYWHDYKKIVVLRHERVHMRQARKYGLILFALLYLFLPLPLGLAYFRARFEWEAYEESMRAEAEYNDKSILASERFKEHIVKQFVTGAYGWMWPFRATVERWYEESAKKITESR